MEENPKGKLYKRCPDLEISFQTFFVRLDGRKPIKDSLVAIKDSYDALKFHDDDLAKTLN